MNGSQNILLEAGTNELEILSLYIDEKLEDGTIYRGYYGLNVAKILEIIQIPSITKIVSINNKYTLGAFILREKVIPLICLASWLEKEIVPSGEERVVVCEFSGVTNGFIVSGVEKIYRINWQDVSAPSDDLFAFSAGRIIGVVKQEERVVFLLDLEHMINEMENSDSNNSFNKFDAVYKNKELYVTGTKRIFFVDDSASIRTMIQTLLEHLGYTVIIAQEGKEAWEFLQQIKARAIEENKEIKNYIDCIITDIEMPEMDGHTLTRKTKEDSLLKSIPVILFSSIVTENTKHKGESVGAEYQIDKSKINLLAEVLHKVVTE